MKFSMQHNEKTIINRSYKDENNPNTKTTKRESRIARLSQLNPLESINLNTNDSILSEANTKPSAEIPQAIILDENKVVDEAISDEEEFAPEIIEETKRTLLTSVKNSTCSVIDSENEDIVFPSRLPESSNVFLYYIRDEEEDTSE